MVAGAPEGSVVAGEEEEVEDVVQVAINDPLSDEAAERGEHAIHISNVKLSDEPAPVRHTFLLALHVRVPIRVLYHK